MGRSSYLPAQTNRKCTYFKIHLWQYLRWWERMRSSLFDAGWVDESSDVIRSCLPRFLFNRPPHYLDLTWTMSGSSDLFIFFICSHSPLCRLGSWQVCWRIQSVDGRICRASWVTRCWRWSELKPTWSCCCSTKTGCRRTLKNTKFSKEPTTPCSTGNRQTDHQSKPQIFILCKHLCLCPSVDPVNLKQFRLWS